MTIRLHLTKSLYRRPAVCTVPAVRYFSLMALLPRFASVEARMECYQLPVECMAF